MKKIDVIVNAVWGFIAGAAKFCLVLILALVLFLILYIAYGRLESKFNLHSIKNSLAHADELCVISSYSVRDSYVELGDGRKVFIEWDIGKSDDGLFIAILLKDDQVIKSLSLIRPDAESLNAELRGCKKL